MEKVVILCLICTLGIAYASVDEILTLNPEPALVNGLSWTFYKTTCPDLESVVRKRINFHLKEDITQAAGLLRVHFHDCFVQGCDGSVLLDGSASGPSEQDAPPNLTLRAKAFEIINDIKKHVEKACSGVVSCADLTALAARESVRAVGGPEYRVPLGRKDSLKFATRKVTLANLPSPTFNATTLINAFAKKKLDVTDLVSLSGGHSIGIAHCSSFANRLYPTQDSTLNKNFAKGLYTTCPSNTTTNTTVLDIRTPNLFDNKYYVDLVNRQGVFTSDQDLYTHSSTRAIVKKFADDQDLFFQKFAFAIVKMSQLSVLTGSKGEIRSNCSARNPSSIVEVTTEDVMDTEPYVAFM